MALAELIGKRSPNSALRVNRLLTKVSATRLSKLQKFGNCVGASKSPAAGPMGALSGLPYRLEWYGAAVSDISDAL